jgi:hypothetical protein
MLHFRNQQYHEHLNRNKAVLLLSDISSDITKENDVPMATVRRKSEKWKTDSNAELDLIKIINERSFPQPTDLQYEVTAGGDHTSADFANAGKSKEETILIFVDGMSRTIHGDPKQKVKDNLIRTKLRMEGYKVIVISAQALHDKVALTYFFNDLALSLGREDLIQD